MKQTTADVQIRDPAVPPGWARTRLGEIYELRYGKSLPKAARNARGDYPVYGSNGVIGYHDSFLAEGPVIVVGRKGAAGAISFSAKSCWPIDTTYFVRGCEHVDILFSFYLFASLRLDQFDRSTAIPGLNRDDAYDLEVDLPPLTEQQRIVAKIDKLFSELDKGVESLKTARAQLKVYRQAVLKHAFEGKLTAQWREENKDKLETAEQLLTRIKRERTAYYVTALEEWKRALTEWRANDENGRRPAKPKRPIWTVEINRSGLREVPVGWRYFPFGILAVKIRNGISVRPDEKGPLKIFRISAVRPMSFDLQDCRKITDIDGRFQDYRLSYGDLVFTRYSGSRDYVGVSAMYRGDGSHVYPDKLIRCEIKSEVLEPAYLEAATNSGESRAFIEKRIRTTAGQSGISGGDIKAMPVPICSDLEQAEIVRILEAKFKVTEVIESQLEAALVDAETFRRAILKKAFCGELVEQDPNDEPAAVLLERIKAEKASQKPEAKTRQRKVANA